LAPGATGSVTNSGTLAKTAGLGTSVIGTSVSNGGTLEVDSGILDIQGAVTGTGSLNIKGTTTLEFESSVTSTQQANFTGSGNGTLMLTSPNSFGAKISGYTDGDMLDLTTFHDPLHTTFNFVENAGNTQGVLTVTQGSTSVNFTLLGHYATAGFFAQT